MNDSEELFKNKEYIELLYSEERRPKTTYPLKLAHHLHEKIYKKNAKLIDIGCGNARNFKSFNELHGSFKDEINSNGFKLC